MSRMRGPGTVALVVAIAAIAVAALTAHAGGAGESARSVLSPPPSARPPAPPAPPTKRALQPPPAPPAPRGATQALAPPPAPPSAPTSPCLRELDIRGAAGRDQVWITRLAAAGTPDAVYQRVSPSAASAATAAGLALDTADAPTRTLLFIEAPDYLPASEDRGLLTLQVSVLPLGANAMVEFRMRVPSGLKRHPLLGTAPFCRHAERVMALPAR